MKLETQPLVLEFYFALRDVFHFCKNIYRLVVRDKLVQLIKMVNFVVNLCA